MEQAIAGMYCLFITLVINLVIMHFTLNLPVFCLTMLRNMAGKRGPENDYNMSKEGAKGVFKRAADGDAIAQGVIDKVRISLFSQPHLCQLNYLLQTMRQELTLCNAGYILDALFVVCLFSLFYLAFSGG
jgi:hypothetical protein